MERSNPLNHNTIEPGASLYLRPEDAVQLHLAAAGATVESGDPMLFGDWAVMHPTEAWEAFTKLPGLEKYGVDADSLRKFGTVAVYANTQSPADKANNRPYHTAESVPLAILNAPEQPAADHRAA